MAKHTVVKRGESFYVLKRGRVVSVFDSEAEANDTASWLDEQRQAWKDSDEGKAEAGPDDPTPPGPGDPPGPPPKKDDLPVKDDPPKKRGGWWGTNSG